MTRRTRTKTETSAEYTFVVAAEITLNVTVSAASLEDAVDKAKAASVMSLCHQCSRGEDDEWSTSGELDTTPAEAELVEALRNNEDIIEEAREVWSDG